ncbi:MAG: helix-turn-helix domain-containing protein [Euryarchaeota archaeon]|nr:helix-turn-helix domain-containing protein [Euryarchaeota archaeon]
MNEEELAKKIAGEIIMSRDPGKTMRKWREAFNITISEVASKMGISPSVISDYESGKTKSPGAQFIRRYVSALIEIDKERGGEKLRVYTILEQNEAIIDMYDYKIPVKARDIVDVLEATVHAYEEGLDREIHGYTFLDSIKAILSFTALDYLRVYGLSTDRALIFSGVKYGRSPMIAIRAHPIKPAMVIYHQPEKVDELAVMLAYKEKIPLVATYLNAKEVINRLRKLEKE